MTPKKVRLFPRLCAVLLPLMLLGCKVSDTPEDLRHNILLGCGVGVLFVLMVVVRAGLLPTNKDGLLTVLLLALGAVVIAVIVA